MVRGEERISMVRMIRGRCESIGKVVFHVLRFEVLPTPIFTIIFFTAPHFGRLLAVVAHFALESILRKWVYSFKHSGNSRGDHRGPEKVCPDRRSGLKMGKFPVKSQNALKFLKGYSARS